MNGRDEKRREKTRKEGKWIEVEILVKKINVTEALKSNKMKSILLKANQLRSIAI